MDFSEITATLTHSRFAHIVNISPWFDFTPLQRQYFRSWWSNLVSDENFRKYTQRERRILRYHSAKDDPARLEINPDANYHSAVTYDIEYQSGVNVLSYAEKEFIEDPLLQQIIRFDQAVLYALFGQPRPLKMDIHQFRVKATSGQVSPTTSGIHQDGVEWIFMHYINKHNTRPVISEIFSSPNEGDLLFCQEMSQFMETLIVDDKLCWHRASPVEQQDKQQPAWRDLLLVTCRCLPSEDNV